MPGVTSWDGGPRRAHPSLIHPELEKSMSEIQTRDLTEAEALKLTARIREKVTEIWPLIVEAFERRVWLALGLPTWDAYCASHLRGMTPSIDRTERQQRVAELREAGMSTRAIGSALNVDQKTVVNDLRAVEENSSPEERAPVLGLDGKAYAPNRPTPPPDPEPFRAPEPEALPDWVEPPAADRYAEATAREQSAAYMHEFMKALSRSDDFLRFDAERVASLASENVARSLADYAKSVQGFCDQVARSRSGLRLVSGGRA